MGPALSFYGVLGAMYGAASGPVLAALLGVPGDLDK